MREERDNKFDAIPKEIRTNKRTSIVTNPRSETDGTQNTQQTGSKIDMSIEVHASNNESSDQANEDYPLKASEK